MLYGSLFVIYYVIWFIPRISPIQENVLMLDDFFQKPVGHLYSFRPLLFAELGFWNSMFGKGYLTSATPKLLAGVYLSFISLVTVALLRRWGVSLLIASLIPIFYISHPIINEFSLWNILVSCNLSILLILLGYYVMEDASSPRRIILGVIFMTLGISGYQIHVGLLPVLFIGELAIKRAALVRYPVKDAAKKMVFLGMVLMLYLAYVIISRLYISMHMTDLPDKRWLFSLMDITNPSLINAKWHCMSNMYVNLFQPLISYYFSVKTSWHAWKWIPFAAALAIGIGGLACRRSIREVLSLSTVPFILPGTATIVMLPLDTSMTNWRILAPTLYGFCLSLVLGFSLIEMSIINATKGRILRGVVFIRILLICGVGALWLLISFPVIECDSSLRVVARKSELRVLQGIENFWKVKDLQKTRYKVALYPPYGVPPTKDNTAYADKKGIVISYNLIGPDYYTTVTSNIWEMYLKYCGFQPYIINPFESYKLIFLKACGNNGHDNSSSQSALTTVHIEPLRISVICRDGFL